VTDYTVAVLEDAIYLLQLLNDNPAGLSLAEITEQSGFVKNKVFRILYTMEKHHMVERDGSGNYVLGAQLLEFGQGIENRTVLMDASRSVMDRLVVETRESIFLGVISGTDALCIAARESPRSIRLFAQVGRRAPLHSGGVPKVLLASLPRTEQTRLLDTFFENETLIRLGPDNVMDRPTLEATLRQIRQQGYAVVVDELDKGAHSIAAPIRTYQGQVIAAISIAGPSNRFDDEMIEQYVRLVCEAADQISQALGHEGLRSTDGEYVMPGFF
jgi:DNA-binding IclR family transcriptional regulator